MAYAHPPTSTRPRTSQRDLETLDAMAGLARGTSAVIHVVVAREPGVVEYARAAAHAAGLDASVDLMATSVRVRFDGTRR